MLGLDESRRLLLKVHTFLILLWAIGDLWNVVLAGVSIKSATLILQQSIKDMQNLSSVTWRVPSQTRQIPVTTTDGQYDFSLTEYKPTGEHTDSAAPPIVFLHGFLGDSSDWKPLACALSKHRRCIIIDLPGHGLTTCQPNGDQGTVSSQNVMHNSSILMPIFYKDRTKVWTRSRSAVNLEVTSNLPPISL